MTEMQTKTTLDRLLDQRVHVDHLAGTDSGILYAVTWHGDARAQRPELLYLRPPAGEGRELFGGSNIIPWHAVTRIRRAEARAQMPTVDDHQLEDLDVITAAVERGGLVYTAEELREWRQRIRPIAEQTAEEYHARVQALRSELEEDANQ